MRLHRLLSTFVVLLLLATSVAACSAPGVTPPAEGGGETGGATATGGLIGTWNSVTLHGNPVDDAVVPTLIFDASGAVAGHGGCNGYGGTYATESDALRIEGVISTMMACEDQTLMQQEVDFFEAIQRTATYTIEGSTLSLIDADGNTLVTLARA